MPRLIVLKTKNYLGIVFKVDKKLAGVCKDTTTTATNVGNEDGQVLMSVLTCQEGYLGLTSMIDGITQHYTSVDVKPPESFMLTKNAVGNRVGRSCLMPGQILSYA